MFAIIETGGKQYKVKDGEYIYVSKINANKGDTIELDKILLIGGNDITVGRPYVKDAKVIACVEKHGRTKKLRIFKYKPKKNQYKRIGHRQDYTKLLIKTIVA